MVQLQNVNKIYSGTGEKVHALRDLDLNIGQGENVAIVGKSGSGKSTLLNIISGIDRATEGKVVVNDTDLTSLSENQLALWRGRSIGIVFQFYQLLPTLSVLDNVLFPMELLNLESGKACKARALDLLNRVGIADKIKKFPSELSGGERQRVAIARAIANDPPIIIADEPTGNLDSQTSEQVFQLFDMLNKMGKTLITVTHENIQSRKFDRVIRIHDGSIVPEVKTV